MTKKLNHTPGPWEISGTHNHIICKRFENKPPLLICEILGRPWETGPIKKIEAQANIRLMSAAPEMLDCLMEVYTQMDYGNFKKIEEVFEKATGLKIDEVVNCNS